MKMRKKIDELYRERLSRVETPPPPDSWQNISDRLPEKKKNRFLPIWYAMAGTAAAIALVFLIFNPTTPTSGTVFISTSTPSENLNFDPTTPAYREYMNTSSAILEAVVLETRFEIFKQELQNRGMQREWGSREDKTSAIAANGSLAESSAEAEKEDHKITGQPVLAQLEQPVKTQEKPSAEIEGLADGTPGRDQNGAQKPVGNEVVALERKALQNLQEEKYREEIAESNDLSRRFSITPTAAAVYLDNFGGGNLLDDQFSNSESGGEISMAYGVNLAYRVSDKLKLRSGISKVNLAYNTRAVNFASALSSQAITIESPESITIPDGTGSGNTISPAGSLNQNMGFIEVPLELEYTILNKKTAINLIGGLSTLFLESNAVAINAGQYSTHLGEANNINDLSFSANVGVGVHYKITPLFQLNLEPILKYQINTFSNSSKLHSYFFGVYSGFSFKF